MAAAAATATAAISSSFTSIHGPLRECITRSRNCPSFAHQRILPLQVTPIAASLSNGHLSEPISIRFVSRKWRILRVSAAVAEEEAATTTAEAEAEVADEAGSAEPENTVSTKLYFGNLPYNVDSAQLAGIIQPYASPELVE
ncbi:hypothetical protein CRG98_035880, partial [Punica granatum]